MVKQVTIGYRKRVQRYLKKNGPSHCSDIRWNLRIPRGSIYKVLRCELFVQLDDSRWAIQKHKKVYTRGQEMSDEKTKEDAPGEEAMEKWAKTILGRKLSERHTSDDVLRAFRQGFLHCQNSIMRGMVGGLREMALSDLLRKQGGTTDPNPVIYVCDECGCERASHNDGVSHREWCVKCEQYVMHHPR